MKGFRFRYRRLLGLASQQRRQAEAELAGALAAERTAEGAVARAAQRRRAAAVGRTGLVRRGLPAGVLAAGGGYRQDLLAAHRAAEEKLAGARGQVEAAREALNRRRRTERTYERLRLRAQERYLLEAGRREQRILDDLVRNDSGIGD